jgi:hypothetical protein
MPDSLADLEFARTQLLRQFLTLGDLRPGNVSAIPRRCGKPQCHCARPDGTGHPQFRLLRKVKGKTVAESFATPSGFRLAAQQVAEFHRFQALIAQLTSINERICRLRSDEPDQSGWTEEEKKRLLPFIAKSRAKSRRSSV